MYLLISHGFVLIIAALHVYFLMLEMFFWQRKLGLKTFHMTPEYAQQTAKLAANQGLYNGFLAAGLFWSLLATNPNFALQLQYFFLSCVSIAGIFGALTVKPKILFVQAVPAVIALVLLLLR